jgi:hypothetical protein
MYPEFKKNSRSLTFLVVACGVARALNCTKVNEEGSDLLTLLLMLATQKWQDFILFFILFRRWMRRELKKLMLL